MRAEEGDVLGNVLKKADPTTNSEQKVDLDLLTREICSHLCHAYCRNCFTRNKTSQDSMETPGISRQSSSLPNINDLSDRVLRHILSFVSHQQVLQCARVCKRWRTIAYDPKLWQIVSLRPEFGGLNVTSVETLMSLMGVRLGGNLKLMELPMDLITPPVLHELSSKCPRLQNLTLDFSNAVQLHDFSDLIAFPSRLQSLTICLSSVIFLEGFVRRIYNFISTVQILHVIGTYEQIQDDQEEEIYEVLNLHKFKQCTPNLTVVNLFGVCFVSDEHVESLASGCVHLECLAVSFCQRVKGTCIKPLLHQCGKLTALLMENCALVSSNVMAAEWEKSRVTELNIACNDLSEQCLISVLIRLPNLTWLNAAFHEGFTDHVLQTWMNTGACGKIVDLDINTCDYLTSDVLLEFICAYGHQLTGLNLGGLSNLLEPFWHSVFPILPQIRTIVMGVAEDCCPKVLSRIHIDKFLSSIAENCSQLERLEIRWDPETLRFSDRSSKFIDVLRKRCHHLKSLVLSDGRYYEIVRSNFERTGKMTVARTTTTCHTNLLDHLAKYHSLLFN